MFASASAARDQAACVCVCVCGGGGGEGGLYGRVGVRACMCVWARARKPVNMCVCV